LNVVASLPPKELEVARTIYELQRNITSPLEMKVGDRIETWRLCEESIREQLSLTSDDLPLFLNRITSTGLTITHYEVYASGRTIPTY
jgi:hypothetical protein